MHQGAVQDLIDELGRLPGVGPKSAQRIAFHILNSPPDEMQRLAGAITTVKAKVSFCETCGNISETPTCAICRDARRDPTVICVVEEPKDVSAIERTGSFNGRYHVLGGSINPMQGIGPDRLRIRELVTRLSDEQIQEIILAMDPNLEGEATATFLSRTLTPIGITVSRLASGLPVGGDLEYADEITLGRALEGRRILTAGARTTPAPAPEQHNDAEYDLEDPQAPEGPEGSEGSEGSGAKVASGDGAASEDTSSEGSEAGEAAGTNPTPHDDDARPSPSRPTPAPQASPAEGQRRYPAPRREHLANPWA